MLMLPGVGLALDRHGRMGAVGVVAAARWTMAMAMTMTMTMTMHMIMTGMIRPAGGRLGRGHRVVAAEAERSRAGPPFY
jgi:hypothetical protein